MGGSCGGRGQIVDSGKSTIKRMNNRAQEFVNAFYADYLNAVNAVTQVLKAWGQYELDPAAAVRNKFLETTLTYVEHCGERVTDELAEFSMDVYCYLNDEISNWIYDMNTEEKRRQIFNFIEALSDGEPITLDGLASSLEYVFELCRIYDDATGDTVQRSFSGALTRFAYLLIQTDSTVTKSEESFYSFFKEGLAKALTHSVNTTHSNDITVDPANNAEPTLVSPEEELEKIQSDLKALIGLENIKQEISDLLNLLKVQRMRRDSGLASPEMSRHMVFYGNPGTGKTTIARKLAEIYKTLGILSKGHLIETDRSSLVAGYLGQTAIKTKEVLERASGGILFIDEAYTLCQGSDQDQFGQEAIDTILKYMEDHRDDLIVIVAGYESQMAAFIDSNPGLKSRFSKYFYFTDYDPSQLADIFEEMATHAQYIVTDSFRLSLRRLCQEMVNRKTDNFGNGRTIRNLFERCISNQANRVVAIPNPSQGQLAELIDGDLSFEDLVIVTR
jgi:AAA+ superfamily predicted ATPase